MATNYFFLGDLGLQTAEGIGVVVSDVGNVVRPLSQTHADIGSDCSQSASSTCDFCVTLDANVHGGTIMSGTTGRVGVSWDGDRRLCTH